MKFKEIIFKGWRQFSEVDIKFHPRLTIITGANGAGKSTILKVLSQHFGWHHLVLSTPKYSKESGGLSYYSGLFNRIRRNKEIVENPNNVGTLTYENGVEAALIMPESASVTNNLQISNQQPIDGLYISSHRPLQTYKAITNIPVTAMGANEAYELYSQEMRNLYHGSYSQFSPMYRMKETIISMATFGAGNEYVQKNPELESLFIDFKIILSKVLPPTIGFLDISIRIPDVVIVTETGEFVIDAASGGLSSIIDLAWQIFLFSYNKNEFTVTLDEPENHLHPSMQRSLLSRLIDAFPKGQFIIATHSPFMVSSVKNSFVYVLKYQDSVEETENPMLRRITSIKLDIDSKASTAGEILRDVLGVPVTLPEWAEKDLESISNKYNIEAISAESINNLRDELHQAGLGEYYPEALKIMVEKRDD